jgi:hypothetical protein
MDVPSQSSLELASALEISVQIYGAAAADAGNPTEYIDRADLDSG